MPMPMPANGQPPNGPPERHEVLLRQWTDGDLDLLRRANTAAMTEHLGGPETDEQILSRHERYLASNDPRAGLMYSIVLPPGHEPAGAIGYWERVWRGESVYEMGWNVFPEFQGRGIAALAATKTVAEARAQRRHRYIHAHPATDNPASNAVCRKVGFSLLGECAVEYPPGQFMRCHDWRLDLRG